MPEMKNPRLFQRPQDLYLASADKISSIVERVQQLSYFFKEPSIDKYYSVIGGLSGLNHLLVIDPKEIVFFDINEDAIPYCNFIIELVKGCESHTDFIESYFLRKVEGSLNENNQEDYLSKPIDEQRLETTLSKLSEESQNVYKQAVLPLVKGEAPLEASNCMRVVPCWNPHHRVPVGGGEATGCDESGKRVPNTNTFFYGYGWLHNKENYNKVKENLASSAVQVKVINLLDCDLSFEDEEQLVIHISNIDDWFPQETASSLTKIMESCRSKNGSFGIATSLNHIYIMSKDPHSYAYDSVKKHVSMPLVEVTHKKPWGFHEFERTNVTIDDFLKQDPTTRKGSCILHILAGEGIEKEKVSQALEKSIKEFPSVIVMEHNSDSLDWPTSNDFYSKEELEEQIERTIKESKENSTIKKFEFVRGEKCQQRNMIFVINR